jgi:hypothetical protein
VLPLLPRSTTLNVRIVRLGVLVSLELRTVAVVRDQKVIAIEGVARWRPRHFTLPDVASGAFRAPTQQPLAALMCAVHDLLERALPAALANGRATWLEFVN